MTHLTISAPRYFIGKVRISAVTMTETLRLLNRQVHTSKPAYVCVANVETTILSQKNKRFCHIQNNSFLTIPDGMPLVWYAKLANIQNVERITGIDLMETILHSSSGKRHSHFFYGDTEHTLLEMTKIIKKRYKGTVVKGIYSPPFRTQTEEEINDITSKINFLKPTFIWVALGAPKQEQWMARVVKRIDTGILVGVGAAFRVFTGYYQRPHPTVRKLGLEGGYWRFQHKPFREILWYCYYIPAFTPLFLRSLAYRFLK